ncbi:hypothetical protein [Paenibacillus sp. FSL M7-1046]|uniref:hypothetical protein n=1 Tax=Paenibacillus sp. FSL M7-1046 TaxID=2975315 RepID=UPI0030FB52A3
MSMLVFWLQETVGNNEIDERMSKIILLKNVKSPILHFLPLPYDERVVAKLRYFKEAFSSRVIVLVMQYEDIL